MSDLLPCPFCGGTNIGLLRHFSYYPHGVMCRHCYASATSIERWNKRTLPAVQPQVNETPKTEQDREDVLTPDAAAIREAASREALDAATASSLVQLGLVLAGLIKTVRL